MKIILDAMGGDNAPQAPVEGAVLAAQQYGCNIILVGRQEELEPALAGRCRDRITVHHASEVITMEDKYSTAFRAKKDSSMTVGLELLNRGEGDVLISAGSTGALLTGATLLTKRIRGIRRAALGAPIPQRTGGYALLLDSGETKPCACGKVGCLEHRPSRALSGPGWRSSTTAPRKARATPCATRPMTC